VPHRSALVGSVPVVPLCDGYACLPLADELPGKRVDWEAERRSFPWAFHGESGWAWHVHAFLLQTAGGLTLIDTGIGQLGQPPYDVVGRVHEELGSVGISPGDIRHVVHTHLHADHAGGACQADGGPQFPNAVHYVHPADWSFFARSTDRQSLAGRMVMTVLEKQGRLDLGPDDREVVKGVRLVHTPGHTPGHRSVVLADGPTTLLLAGDLLHLPIQVAHPEWASSHDQDPALGCETRIAILNRALENDWGLAVSHFAQPFGTVLRSGSTQAWGPLPDPVSDGRGSPAGGT
jgi:glyoxylase-like metal-dependent hydrolase (beta-lactamase superfamily II)